MKILVINGPNLNFLGIREKAVYGTQNYDYLLDLLKKKGEEAGCQVETFQSNHEGAIIDRIQEAYFDGTDGIVIKVDDLALQARVLLQVLSCPQDVCLHLDLCLHRPAYLGGACESELYGLSLLPRNILQVPRQ